MTFVSFLRSAVLALVLLIVASPSVRGENPALADAQRKVRELDSQISRAESARRQLSPPIRFTDKKGTTFDVDKQKRYESAVARADREIQSLRAEKRRWELRANGVVARQDAAPAEARGNVARRPAESPALVEARRKVKDLEFQLSSAESARRQLSPPIRITDRTGTTFDADKQKRYDLEVARADRNIRALREEKRAWELRVNRLIE